MMEELNEVSLSIQKVLGEVPLDLRVRGLLFQILIHRADVVSDNFHLAHERECNSVCGENPLFNGFFTLRLLVFKLVAGESEDLESTLTHSTIHTLICSIVLVRKTSLRGYVYDDDRFCSVC